MKVTLSTTKFHRNLCILRIKHKDHFLNPDSIHGKKISRICAKVLKFRFKESLSHSCGENLLLIIKSKQMTTQA